MPTTEIESPPIINEWETNAVLPPEEKKLRKILNEKYPGGLRFIDSDPNINIPGSFDFSRITNPQIKEAFEFFFADLVDFLKKPIIIDNFTDPTKRREFKRKLLDQNIFDKELAAELGEDYKIKINNFLHNNKLIGSAFYSIYAFLKDFAGPALKNASNKTEKSLSEEIKRLVPIKEINESYTKLNINEKIILITQIENIIKGLLNIYKKQ